MNCYQDRSSSDQVYIYNDDLSSGQKIAAAHDDGPKSEGQRPDQVQSAREKADGDQDGDGAWNQIPPAPILGDEVHVPLLAHRVAADPRPTQGSDPGPGGQVSRS